MYNSLEEKKEEKAMASFKEFALSDTMVAALKKQGYESPSPVQERIIPKALRGASLVCQSSTGSGKTHAFLIPTLSRIDFSLNRLQAIIIAPSRELARQIYDFAIPFKDFYPSLKVRLFTSEVEKTQNQQGLSISPQIVIGTPGRLYDMLSKDYELDLHGVKMLILDEADMLMELGYFDEVDSLFDKLPEKVQTMVFSATLEEGLKAKLAKYIASSFLFEGEETRTATSVSHHLVDIKHGEKEDALLRFLKAHPCYLAMIFSSTKEGVKKAAQAMKDAGLKAIAFYGDLDERERRKAIRAIKSNEYQYIVCSDLLSRGIDILDVTDVISLDLPFDNAYYYHRAGRTGRFDRKGDSWVFYNRDSLKKPRELQEEGVAFDYYELKGERLVQDELGLLNKRVFTNKKKWDNEDEAREIKIAKARTRSDKVKPGYKKKTERAIERVKGKYRRKAIKASIKKVKDQKYREKAKKDKGE